MINPFLLNLFLAIVYVALLGSVTFLDFVIGFLVGMGLMVLLNHATGGPSYLHRLWRLLRFGGYFTRILIRANLQVASEILTPGLTCRPCIIRYPVDGLTAGQLTTLANAITLTPGTLSADHDEERQMLYIHCMYGQDRHAAVAEINELRHRLLHDVFGVTEAGAARSQEAEDIGHQPAQTRA